MKKSLLALALVAGAFTSADAQVTYFQQVTKPLQGSRMVTAPQKAQLYTGALMKKNAPKKAAAAEAYAMYDMPVGTLYDGAYDEGWYSTKHILLPGMVRQTFTNYSSGRNTGATYLWQLDNGLTVNGKNFTDSTAVNGELQLWGWAYAPTLTQYSADGTTQTYTPQYTYKKQNYNALLQCGADSAVLNLSNACPSEGVYDGFSDGGSFTSKQEFWTMKDGEFVKTGKNLTGFMELYEPLSSQVYTSGVYFLVAANNVQENGKALFAGVDTLKAELCTVGSNGIEAPFAVATATASDVVAYGDQSQLFLIKYKFYDIDPVMGVQQTPITLPVGKTFAVVLPGFDKLNNSVIGLFGPANGFTGHGYAILNDGSISTMGYSNDADLPQTNLHVGFTDCAEAVAYAPSDTVYFDAKGGNLQNEMEGKVYSDAAVYTMLTGWDVEADEWITPKVDESYINQYQMLDITGTAEALPANVKGRMGKITLSRPDLGKTVTIVCIQGDKDAATGIKGIEANKETKKDGILYNLAGQRVSKDYKGLVIKNGRKYVNK